MAVIKVVNGPGTGEQVEFEGEAVLGRFRGCDLQVKDQGASRRHARVLLRDGKPWVEDLESSNGTFVNDKRITEQLIYDGDKIRIGTVTMEYTNPEAARPAGAEVAKPFEAKKEAAAEAKRGGAEEVELVEVKESGPKEAFPAIPGHTVLRRVRGDELTTTYLATEHGMGRPVGVELLSAEASKDAEAALARIRLAAQMSHPAVASIHRAETADGKVFLTREPANGKTMWELAGKMPADEVAETGALVAEALAEAHGAGLVHGSLRPDRIIRSDRAHVTLLGLGLPTVRLGELSPEPDLQKQPSRVGYAAPEVVAGGAPSAASDVYSLGATLYHMLCGRAPFVAVSEAELAPRIASEGFIKVLDLKPDAPKGLAKVIEKMMSRAPGERYRTMGEAADALEDCVGTGREQRPVAAVMRAAVVPEGRGGMSTSAVIIVVLSILLLLSVLLLGRLGGIWFIQQGAN